MFDTDKKELQSKENQKDEKGDGLRIQWGKSTKAPIQPKGNILITMEKQERDRNTNKSDMPLLT